MTKIISGEQFYTVPDAAKRLDVPRMTMYRWATRALTPQGDGLKVVKDSLTNHYYIARQSVDELARRYHSEKRFRVVVPIKVPVRPVETKPKKVRAMTASAGAPA